MFTKTLLASAVAGAIALGTLGASTTSASAGGPGFHGGIYFGGPGWHVGIKPPAKKVCFPTYQKVKYWKPYHGWVWKTVYTGTKCTYKPIYW